MDLGFLLSKKSSFSDIEREERNAQKTIKDLAKRNDMVSAKVQDENFSANLIIGERSFKFSKSVSLLSLMLCVSKALAKEIVTSRRTVNRLHVNKAQLNSISMHLGQTIGT